MTLLITSAEIIAKRAAKLAPNYKTFYRDKNYIKSNQDICRVIQNDCRDTIVQRQFRTKFGKQPPSDNSIRMWYAQFQETGCVCIPELKVRIRTATETITADRLHSLERTGLSC